MVYERFYKKDETSSNAFFKMVYFTDLFKEPLVLEVITLSTDSGSKSYMLYIQFMSK